MMWLIESPDISVVMCLVHVAGRDPDAEPTEPEALLTWFHMLTMAAYLIEHPGSDPVSTEVQVAGMSAGLRVFRSVGGTPGTPTMQELFRQLDAGTLSEWWEQNVTCGE